MELSIILITLLSTLANETPDLCADVYLDPNGSPYTDALGQMWSRYCKPAGPTPPVLDTKVCCAIDGDNARCTTLNRKGRCSFGSITYCQYGEVTSRGAVVCYQPFSSACDLGFCGEVMPPDAGPMWNSICCWSSGACIEIETYDDLHTCAVTNGYGAYCENGVQNDDGTVECFD